MLNIYTFPLQSLEQEKKTQVPTELTRGTELIEAPIGKAIRNGGNSGTVERTQTLSNGIVTINK